MRRKNESVEMGFYDSKGRFHPIRASDDYDPDAVGEGRQYARAKKKKAKKSKKNPTRANVVKLRNFTGRVTRQQNGAIKISGKGYR